MTEKFPSIASLRRLADRVNDDPEHYERLGLADCALGLRVEDTGEEYTVVFETYGCTGVEAGAADADFILEAPSDIWQAMYDDIVAHGKPGLDQTINHLALPGINMRVIGKDQLAEDLFYRYNQTFQSYFDEAGHDQPARTGG